MATSTDVLRNILLHHTYINHKGQSCKAFEPTYIECDNQWTYTVLLHHLYLNSLEQSCAEAFKLTIILAVQIALSSDLRGCVNENEVPPGRTTRTKNPHPAEPEKE
jgi:NADPH-dependent 7-cyano-7-deazaguanine reductase QueF-like protein